MSRRLDIFIHGRGVSLGRLQAGGYRLRLLTDDVADLDRLLAQAQMARTIAGAEVDVYISEDLLFFSTINLPRQTPDIKKAIDLQIDILSPFADDSLTAFAFIRQQEDYRVTLYFCRRSLVIPVLESLFAAGAHLTGLFPESQRYLTRANQKKSWSLRHAGRLAKISHFEQGTVVDRDLCTTPVESNELGQIINAVDLTGDDPELSADQEAGALLDQPASGRAYDMLPATFRRPDYLKKALLILTAINIVLLLALGAGKGLAIYRQADLLDQQISATKVKADKALELKGRINTIKKELESYRSMGSNIDLIAFMATLSSKMPTSAYLDQLRLDSASRTVTLQGYTDDLNELTAAIPDLGAATLKSTMKRRNKTYFHLEVNLP